MRCWNCGKIIPDSAKVCTHCEAKVDDAPTEEEKEAVRQMLEQMDPEAKQELMAAFASSQTAEEFANRVIVGNCPKCGGSNTGDCDADPEIANGLVGRCLDCGCHWCIWCERILDKAKPECECWDEDLPFE